MHPFAVGLICTLVGAIAGILFATSYNEKREVAAFEEGRHYEREVVARKHSERGKRAAATRRAKP